MTRPEPPEKPTDEVNNATQRYEIKNDKPELWSRPKNNPQARSALRQKRSFIHRINEALLS